MLEKMVQISSATNEIWPQQNNESRDMEKSISQDQQPLKCPRCNSSNTKFCYYNNYSLSQPRHFCKGCKRYWTRGGTIRNVPVGGACRKNKKIKKPNITTTTNPSHNFHQPQIIDLPPAITPNQLNPNLFYGFPTNPSDLDIQFPRLFNISRVSNTENLELGFSYGQIQDVMTTTNSNSHLSSYPILNSTLSSLIASNLQQQNFISNNNKFQDLSNYNGEGGNGLMLKGLKMEGENQNRLDWNISNHQINQIEQINSDDPSLSWAGTYVDPSKIESSVPSF